jgi:hypothetical protein
LLDDEVLTAVIMTSRPTIFWDVTPCSPVEVHRRFGGTYYLQGRRVRQANNQQEASNKQAVRSSETSVTSTGLRGATYQKIVLLKIKFLKQITKYRNTL